MMVPTSRYLDQLSSWPREGRHILAHFDAGTIVVYQAYAPSIGRWAVEHGHLGGPDFSYGRMSWVKPNFLWMMYRSGWGTKPNQETTLGLRIRRSFFEGLLEKAVESTFREDLHQGGRERWTQAVATSDVRLQWDPDHDPYGVSQPRRGVQLGLRGKVLEQLGRHEILEVLDLSDLVAEQRAHVAARRLDLLETPTEAVYVSGARTQ